MAAGFENTFFASSVFVMALDRSRKVGEPRATVENLGQQLPEVLQLCVTYQVPRLAT